LCSAFLNSGVRSLLDADALKALIVVQHQSRISIQDPLIATPEQLRSRIKIADRQAAAHGTWALVRQWAQQIQVLEFRLKQLQLTLAKKKLAMFPPSPRAAAGSQLLTADRGRSSFHWIERQRV